MFYINFKKHPKARKYFGAYLTAYNKERAREVLTQVFKPRYVNKLMKEGVHNEYERRITT